MLCSYLPITLYFLLRINAISNLTISICVQRISYTAKNYELQQVVENRMQQCCWGNIVPGCQQYHRLRIYRCATRDISCLTWMAWVRHTHAHFWQVQMQDFIRN